MSYNLNFSGSLKKRMIWGSLLVAQCLLADAAATKEATEPQQQNSGMSVEAEANNPLANFVAFNIQNYNYASMTDTDDTANATMLRFVMPTGKILWRLTAPIMSSYPHGIGLEDEKSESGPGDLNLFAAYLISDPSSSVQFGIGPMVNVPTGDDEKGLGTGNWSAGFAAVYYNATNPVFQWGGLFTWAKSFNENKEDEYAKKTNLIVSQPFAFVQLGNGLYTGSAPLWQYDLETDNYNIPVGIRLGKVKKIGKTVANFFIEPQYTVIHRGPGQPEFQIFMAVNLQFTDLMK